MDENNQYGQAMTKPLPTGCIEEGKNIPGCHKFNLFIEQISAEDNIAHLFIVDIKFDLNQSCEKDLLFNEFCSPIFEKEIFISI